MNDLLYVLSLACDGRFTHGPQMGIWQPLILLFDHMPESGEVAGVISRYQGVPKATQDLFALALQDVRLHAGLPGLEERARKGSPDVTVSGPISKLGLVFTLQVTLNPAR